MAEDEIAMPLAVHLGVMEAGSTLVLRLQYELSAERQKNFLLLQLIKEQKEQNSRLEELISRFAQKPSVPRVGSMESIASTAADFEDEAPLVGKYSPAVRQEKIRAYKLKQLRYKQRVHVSRRFQGRSEVARSKPRVNGRFVKPHEELTSL